MVRKALSCMGTGFVFQVLDVVPEEEVARLIDVAGEILEDSNQLFSLYRDDSEISQLVNGSKAWTEASGQAIEVREACKFWSEVTGGFFDARSGSDYDPSGLVKAWATQNAANFLQANGLRQFTINAGGDILLSEDLKDPVLERVGISNLRKIGSAGAGVSFILNMAETPYRAVATSGVVERGEHIWRKTDQKILQATVVGKNLVEADVWATALVSGGEQAWQLFLRQPGLAGLMVFEDLALVASPGFYYLLGTH